MLRKAGIVYGKRVKGRICLFLQPAAKLLISSLKSTRKTAYTSASLLPREENDNVDLSIIS